MKARRGVSEIVATLIILIIVTALSVVLYNFASSTTSTQTTNLISETQREEALAQERLVILSVNGIGNDLSGNPQMKIAFLNYGKVDITISDLYINNIRYTSYSITDAITQTSKINYITVSYTASTTREYNILLVSNRGDVVAYTWKN